MSWVIKGIGDYGAELTKVVQGTGYPVVEAAWMNNKPRRGIGKTDPSDAPAHRRSGLTVEH